MNPFTAVCGTTGELPCSQPCDNRWHITGRPQTRPLKFKIEREQVNRVSRVYSHCRLQMDAIQKCTLWRL